MRTKVKPILPILILSLSTIALFAQDFRIKNYGVREGISHPFVYTINQDTRGYIWIGTGEGLCRFNGFEFNTDIIQDTLAREIAGISYKDRKGTLWFGYYSGDIARYDGKLFERLNPGVELNSVITGFAELDKVNLMFSTLNNGLYIYNTTSGKATKTEGIEEGMFTALYVRQSTILLGSQDGLAIYSLENNRNKAELIKKISETEYIKIQDIQPTFDGKAYWIATEDQGVYRLTMNGNNYTIVKTGVEFNLGNENIQSVLEDTEGKLWLSTLRNGVFMLNNKDSKGKYNSMTVFNKNNGLPGNSVKRVFEDVEGNIWIATYGDGLSLLTGQAFSFRNYQNAGLENDIQSITTINNDVIYIGGPEGLFKVTKAKEETAIKIKNIPGDRITALIADKHILLVGTENNGLFVLNTLTSAVHKVGYEANSLGYSISSIASDSKYYYLGTRDGIYLLDKEFNEKNHFTTSEKLPHNNIEYVFIDSQNRLLFATRTNGIYYLDENGDVINLYPAGDSEIEFKSITEDEKGGIWAATYGDGVYCFKNDSVYHLSASSGLKANYCYSIICGKDQSIWVGHRLGISRINSTNLRVSVYDMNIGMTGDCNLNAIYKDNAGVIIFGTTEGLVTYNPSKDKKRKIPPFTNITRLLISDKPYDADQDIVLPYKLYKLRIEFIGLNYSDPQSVRYQYKLEGNDLEWSDITTQTYVSYPRIEDGNYVFTLKSFNSEGLTQETPVYIHIRVKLPIWKTWWFISLSVIILIFSIYLYIKIRERKQKQLQEYLERELVARTKEVVEQKEVIEIKNRDITDSINYAKRIQTSMLPPVKRLQQFFSGCFVFYSPRDIVSGDFYWFDQVNTNKFVIVCADSTGHGVPGAFMSMIGSTLIKDICSRAENNSPSQVLQVLDNELRNTLNQNLLDDGTKPTDGIDVVVCEIDLKTHYVRYSSAMRPIIIYRNGEEVFVKGSRNSIGGQYDRELNVFEDEGLQLGKGDIIYMFSDGYSDQFGGPMGKKFKLIRLKNLLQEIHTKPMDEQFLHVKNSFHQWKENYDQVDDVLFMGIKI
jgi:ligand-binding sensor domain-containing protein/serine phosphatase RsbU (regulator of sigma subunit)